MKKYEYLAEQAFAKNSDIPQEDRPFEAVSSLLCAVAHIRDHLDLSKKEKDEVGCAMILALAYALFKDPEDQEDALVRCLEEFLAEKGK